MHLRIALLAAILVPAASDASAEFPLCKLFGHHHGRQCCDDCQVHVHMLPAPDAGRHEPAADLPPAAQPSNQLLYAPLLPSTVGYTMPMMSMMPSMPMMMPYPVQQASMGMPMQQQMQQPQRQPQQDAACRGCEERVARLEEGVKGLSERMDKIELILENQTIAMEGIRDALVKGKLLEKPTQN